MLIPQDKTDLDLKMDVLAELKFEPTVKMSDIGVRVKDGVVTLNDLATDYGEKLDVLRAIKRVAGVVAIADDLEINLPEFGKHSDGDMATAAANRINWSSQVPAGAISVTVRNGMVTLEGDLAWGFQKHAAEFAVQHLAGVKGIENLIEVKPEASSEDLG